MALQFKTDPDASPSSDDSFEIAEGSCYISQECVSKGETTINDPCAGRKPSFSQSEFFKVCTDPPTNSLTKFPVKQTDSPTVSVTDAPTAAPVKVTDTLVTITVAEAVTER